MQVPILSQNDVSHLYLSVENNLVKYEEKRDPFHLLNKCKFVAGTEISDNLDSLLILDDAKEGLLDAKNAFIVYSSIKNLTPYQARDERIIAAISHIYFIKYGFFRHKIKKDNKEEKIKKHFFARGNGARSIERLNVFSRLWWRGYFIDQCREDNDLEELLHLLCSDTDFRSAIMERPEIGKTPQLALAVLLCRKRFEKENPGTKFFTGRTADAPFRLWFKKINFFGGSYLYSAMSKDELIDVFWGYMNEIAHAQSR